MAETTLGSGWEVVGKRLGRGYPIFKRQRRMIINTFQQPPGWIPGLEETDEARCARKGFVLRGRREEAGSVDAHECDHASVKVCADSYVHVNLYV